MSPRVFLDIDMGDPEVYAQELAHFDETLKFFEQNRAQLGLFKDAALDSLDSDGQDLLIEAIQSRNASGEPRLTAPPPLCAGRLIVELCSEAPKAVENFRCLCTGERGKGKKSGKRLHYQDTPFHRIVKRFVCQGGDIVKGDGSGGDSIYGGSFKQEKAALKLKHAAAGVVSMASSNESQFFITLASAPQCDEKHVVVGRVVKGLDVLSRIDAEAASEDGTPRKAVRISACGEC